MRKDVSRFIAVLFFAVSAVSLFAQGPAQRHFRFTYAFTVRDVASGKPLSVWFPAATSDDWQDVKVLSVRSDLSVRLTREKKFGDAMYHAATRHPRRSEYHFEVVYDVVRRERVGYRDGHFVAPAAPTARPVLARFTAADSLVPTTGRLSQIAAQQVATAHASTTMQKARAIYDYVFSTMRYDKSGTGWGRGDAEWACDSRHGNCTDFHSLFASLARSQGIPTRFAIGFPIPADKHSGDIPGYHCWADFYAESHWVPVDISEAWQTPSRRNYYFGSHDANRVQFSIGRDIVLSPAQKGKPLNYFVYPYVESGGVEHKNVRYEFAFEDSAPESTTNRTGS